MGYLERRRGAVGFSAAAVLALAAVARRRFCTARQPASLQARGWILHPGPWSIQLLYTCRSPVTTNDRSQHTMITEKGEGELGNVE